MTPAEVTCFCLGHVLMLLKWCRVYGSCAVFNKKLMDFCVPKTMTRTFLNQKLWVDKSIYTALRTNTTACNKELSISNMRKYKAASDKVHRAQSPEDHVPSETVRKNPRALWLEKHRSSMCTLRAGNQRTTWWIHDNHWDRSQLKEDLIPLKAVNLLDVSSREVPTS